MIFALRNGWLPERNLQSLISSLLDLCIILHPRNRRWLRLMVEHTLCITRVYLWILLAQIIIVVAIVNYSWLAKRRVLILFCAARANPRMRIARSRSRARDPNSSCVASELASISCALSRLRPFCRGVENHSKDMACFPTEFQATGLLVRVADTFNGNLLFFLYVHTYLT